MEIRQEFVCIANPNAGNGRGLKVWRQLRSSFPALRKSTVVLADSVGQARAQLTKQLSTGAQRLIAIGGDGTLHLVVNTILEGEFADRVSVAFVAAGTGSDIGRSLGTHADPSVGFAQAVSGSTQPIDLLHFESGDCQRWAVNTISTGLSGVIAARANQEAKAGSMTYFRLLLSSYLSYRPESYSLSADSRPVFSGPALLIAATNGKFFGQGMPVAPHASIDDGQLDLVVIPKIAGYQVPSLLFRFLTGRHIDLAKVTAIQASAVELDNSGDSSVAYEIDGETLVAGPARIELAPKALSVVVPARAKCSE